MRLFPFAALLFAAFIPDHASPLSAAGLAVSKETLSVEDVEGGAIEQVVVESDIDWESKTPAWIKLRPLHAAAGKTELRVLVEANSEDKPRSGKIVLKSKRGSKTIIVSQGKTDFRFSVSHANLELSDTGQGRHYRVSASKTWKITSEANWIKPEKKNGGPGVDIFKIAATPNDTGKERSGKITISMPGTPSLTTTITQGKKGDYYKDGDVIWLNRHKKGKGVAVIIVGDGFDRQDNKKGGYWETAGRVLAENLKKVMVFRDLLSDYIDLGIYIAESKERGTTDDYGHNMSPRQNKFGGHNCTANYDLVLQQLKKIPGINPKAIHACFVANGPYGGWAMGWFSFMSVLQVGDPYWAAHEFVGHILGRMPDLYAPAEVVNAKPTDLAAYHEDEDGLGWMLDATNDPEQVKWKAFLKRPEYVNAGVGFYKAGYYNGLTVWTPERRELSTMHGGTAYFTALERYQLWKRVRWLAGEDWSAEKFFEYDIPINLPLGTDLRLWENMTPPTINDWWHDIWVDSCRG
ncbi:MAG: BACON domain-containing protein [Puniceicoccales bacterium]|jgi:hypothetical protein|nr:BACON domain-containing protein [Puniceicoccales bacterium]